MYIRAMKFAEIGEGRAVRRFTLALQKETGGLRIDVGYYQNPENDDCLIWEVRSHGFASFIDQASADELAAMEKAVAKLFAKARKPKR